MKNEWLIHAVLFYRNDPGLYILEIVSIKMIKHVLNFHYLMFFILTEFS